MSGLYRIVFVTGMKPKPPPELYRAALLEVLNAGLERARPKAAERFTADGEPFALVSWTHLLYDVPRDIRQDLPGIERLVARPVADASERREIDALGRRLKRLWRLVGDACPILTRLVADRELESTLAEAHQYLEDREGVAVAIRALLKSVLDDAWQRGERVLLIGHSLGSVIAYDTLWELSRIEGNGGRIEQLLTLGSPLATRFIRTALKGADRPPPERYPSNIDRWANFSARAELVALHPKLEPYFRDMVSAGLVASIDDHTDLYNPFHEAAGINPHRAYGYLIHEKVACLVGDWLAAIR